MPYCERIEVALGFCGEQRVHVITPTTPEFKMFTSMRFKTPRDR
uniref:Uncharacterized protein n=1 Tax=Ralstonia solanacearum CFBP2957 TaxID=859656 RepID=D8P3F4_RALSL|nr:protein of unknown function [Ralstonia solanacearum CFBP2957]